MSALTSLDPAVILDAQGRRDGASIRDVFPALSHALGVGPKNVELVFPPAERVVLVVVDGMGWNQVGERLAHARAFLRPTWGRGRPLLTCVPSTTAAAITTLTCSAWPGETNMLGYEVVDEASGPLNLLTFSTRGHKRAVEADGWNPCPTGFHVLAAQGRTSLAVVPAKFAGSGLSRQALDGAQLRFARSIDERVDVALASHRDAALTYLYFDQLDHIGHREGWDSVPWLSCLDDLDVALARLVDGVAPGTLIVLTSDHGMINPDPTLTYDIAAGPLSGDRVELGGEPRALHVHVRQGPAGEVYERWRDELGDQADVIAREDLAQLIGTPVRPDLVGDFWVFARGRGIVVDSRVHTPQARAMKGVHGSLTRDETEVPLLVVPAR